MKSSIVISAATVILLAAGSVLFSAEEPNAPKKSYESYKVIYERNIFSKDRLPPREERSDSGQVRKTQVLSIYVLRGIAGPQDGRVAFIEEQVSGQTLRANIGTEVLNGEITAIQYDRVAFEQNGQTKYVKVGGEFGKTETTVLTTASEEPQEAKPVEVPAEKSSPGDESDILKRLMERRKNELGQ